MGVHQGSSLRPLLFVLVMQEAAREARGEGLWDLYADDLVIIADVWKRDGNYRGLKVNINKTKLMVMGKEPAVRPQRESTHVGLRQRSWSKLNTALML